MCLRVLALALLILHQFGWCLVSSAYCLAFFFITFIASEQAVYAPFSQNSGNDTQRCSIATDNMDAEDADVTSESTDNEERDNFTIDCILRLYKLNGDVCRTRSNR